jgi:hypothetical protein
MSWRAAGERRSAPFKRHVRSVDAVQAVMIASMSWRQFARRAATVRLAECSSIIRTPVVGASRVGQHGTGCSPCPGAFCHRACRGISPDRGSQIETRAGRHGGARTPGIHTYIAYIIYSLHNRGSVPTSVILLQLHHPQHDVATRSQCSATAMPEIMNAMFEAAFASSSGPACITPASRCTLNTAARRSAQMPTSASCPSSQLNRRSRRALAGVALRSTRCVCRSLLWGSSLVSGPTICRHRIWRLAIHRVFDCLSDCLPASADRR